MFLYSEDEIEAFYQASIDLERFLYKYSSVSKTVKFTHFTEFILLPVHSAHGSFRKTDHFAPVCCDESKI